MKKKFLLAVVMVLLFCSAAFAAPVSRLSVKENLISDPLCDYSAFVKIKFEKYNEIFEKIFRTVRRNYFERYDQYREVIDILNKDNAYDIDRA